MRLINANALKTSLIDDFKLFEILNSTLATMICEMIDETPTCEPQALPVTVGQNGNIYCPNCKRKIG